MNLIVRKIYEQIIHFGVCGWPLRWTGALSFTYAHPHANSVFASDQHQWAYTHLSWGLCTRPLSFYQWGSQTPGVKDKLKAKIQMWFGRNWSYCKIFQDEPTGGPESSWQFNSLKKRMGFNLDHVLRRAAEHGGRVWQTCPDYNDCPLHIWISWKWSLSSSIPCFKIVKCWAKLLFCGQTLLHVVGFVPQGCPRVPLETSPGLRHLRSGVGECKTCAAPEPGQACRLFQLLQRMLRKSILRHCWN